MTVLPTAVNSITEFELIQIIGWWLGSFGIGFTAGYLMKTFRRGANKASSR